MQLLALSVLLFLCSGIVAELLFFLVESCDLECTFLIDCYIGIMLIFI